MAEETLKTYSTKDVETLVDYVDYLRLIRANFLIGSSNGLYEPKYQMLNKGTPADSPEFHYEFQANCAREMANEFRERLNANNVEHVAEQLTKCKAMLKLDLADSESRALIMQLGYADELVRRRAEIIDHDYDLYELTELKSTIASVLHRIKRVQEIPERESTPRLPKQFFDTEITNVEEWQREAQALIEKEQQFLSTKRQEFDQLLLDGFCDRERKLPEDYLMRKSVTHTLLAEVRRNLAKEEICQHETQYRDSKAGALKDSVEVFLQNKSHFHNYSMLCDAFWRMVEEFKEG